MDSSDPYWLMLLLAMCFGNSPDPMQNMKETIKKIEADREWDRAFRQKQLDCPDIEWEHDMGATIPFCRLTNDICDGHCMKGE